MELKKHLSNNGIHEEERRIIMENIKALGGMDKNGRKGKCGQEKMGKSDNDIPIIWRKHMGNIVKASFCEIDGEWYWSKVATCGGGD